MTKTRPYRLATLAVAGIMALTTTGCLISGTQFFSYTLTQILNVVAGSCDEVLVDLTNNTTFNDHKDDIKLIDRFGFECTVTNNVATPGEVTVWFSSQSGIPCADLATHPQVFKLFEDFAVPASGAVTIDYDESQEILLDFDELLELVKGGVFTLYATGSGIDFTIDPLTVFITFTVGL